MDRPARLPAGPFSLAFFALAFARLWVSVVFVGVSSSTLYLPLSHTVFDVAYTAAAIAVLLASRRLAPLWKRRWPLAFSLAGMLAASVVFVLRPWVLPSVAPVLGVAAAAVAGPAFLMFSFLNVEALAGVSLIRALLYLSGSGFLGSAMAFFLSGTGSAQVVVAALALPAVAVALLGAFHGTVPEHDRQQEGLPVCPIPWKLFAVVAVFSLTYGMRQAGFPEGVGRHSSLTTALAGGAVFLVAYFFPQRFDFSRLTMVPLAILACAALLMPTEGVFGQEASAACVSVGFTVMRYVVTLVLLDMAKSNGALILPLAALNSSMQGVCMLGGFAEEALRARAGSSVDTVLAVVTMALVIAAAVLLFVARDELTRRWGVRVLEKDAAGALDAQAAEQDRLDHSCRRVAQMHHLTERECEVLKAVMSGLDTEAILARLVIAPGTLRAHSRHIYEKTGVHNRAELEAYVRRIGAGD